MNHHSIKVSAAMKAALTRTVDTKSTELGQALSEVILDSIDTLGRQHLPGVLGEAIQSTTRELDHVSVAVTGLGWLGAGFPAVERVLLELIQKAKREVLITAYSVTGGAEKILGAIERALETGVRCTLIVNALSEQRIDVQQALLGLKTMYPITLSLYDFVGGTSSTLLHAKTVIIDRETVLIGSANLSFHGLVASHELAVIVTGPTADKIARRIDALLNSKYVEPIS